MSSNLESRDMQMSRKLRIIVGMFVMLFGYTSTNIAQPSKRLQIEAVDESEPQVQNKANAGAYSSVLRITKIHASQIFATRLMMFKGLPRSCAIQREGRLSISRS